MNERNRRRLKDMLDYSTRAVRMLGPCTFNEFVEDEKTRLAAERAVEIVGEAASKLDDSVKADFDLPWPAIVTTRNILAHVYQSIDYRIIYEVVRNELPELIRVLQDGVEKSSP